MSINLDQRSRKAMRLGFFGVMVILLATVVLNWLDNWRLLRQSIAQNQKQLAVLANADESLKGLHAKVPVVQIPQKEQKQLFAFRDSLNTQFKRAGIQVKPFKVSFVTKSPKPEYQYLFVQCSGKGSFGGVLNLLADLKKNPYLVGIEELVISKASAGNSQSSDVNLELKVSTFVKR